MKTIFTRFEYDMEYSGGDYNKVGNFAYVPCKEIGNDPEKTFEEYTGISRIHIIHYTLDEVYVGDGNSMILEKV